MRTQRLLTAGGFGAAMLGAALLGLAAPAHAASPAPSTPSTPSTSASPSPSPSASNPASNPPTPPTDRPLYVFFKVGPDFGGSGSMGKATVSQGGRVQVGAPCFTEPGGTAESTAFGTITLVVGEGGSGARTTVRADAKPGEHVVTVRCADGGIGRGVLTVTVAQTKTKPSGGAETGAGGGTETATTIAAAGIAATALVGAGLVGYRRRRQGARA